MPDSSGLTLHPTVEVSGSTSVSIEHGELPTGGAIGSRIGRYVVVDEVGVGGMGRVYRAYDPKLRREVAIKRLRVAGKSAAIAQARMLREAQSMAKLSHPNVVPVYDVDIDDGSLFIAMEYVDGLTLRAWVEERGPDWKAILSVFLEAGEGLAAAHRQGIVHRDFKPANVIVGRDGRTRVMDFGLARLVDELPSSDSRDPGESGHTSASGLAELSEALTDHGTVMGTPAYMAPEQHMGNPTDARTDQYAFCTALWEALYGDRPFRATSLERLAAAKQGRLPRPANAARVPGRVHTALVTGLAVTPEDRWPDMIALLAALRRARRGRRWWPAIAVASSGLALGGVAWVRSAEPPCAHGESDPAAVWTPQTRAEIREALSRTGAGFAESTAERVELVLDRYAASIVEMQREACEATHVRREQSDEALDLRMGCLSSRREELRTTIALLTSADAELAEKAIDLTSGLTPISRCADIEALRSRVPPPFDPETARAVEAARSTLIAARTAGRAGRYDDAMATTATTLETAHTLGYEPLVVEATLGHAVALWGAGRDDEAQPLVAAALEAAVRLSMQHVAAEAAVALTAIINARQGRAAEAQWLARVALALAEGDGTDASVTAEAMLLVGNLEVHQERLLEAEPYFRGALEHVEHELGPDHPELVPVLSAYISLLDALERTDEAQALSTRARALAETAFGPDHPHTAGVIRQEAWRMMKAGQYAAAETAFTEAKTILETALGPAHPSTIGMLGTMAGALAEQGHYEAAVASIEEAERRLGDRVVDDHPMRASLSHNLATIYFMQGDHAAAVERYRHAIDIRRRLGMKNDLAAGLGQLGRSLVALERWEEAERAFEESDGLDAEAAARGRPRSAVAGLELGKLARRRGDLQAARERFETAWTFSRAGLDARVQAEAALELGKLLWDLRVERDRAHTLVRQALELATNAEGAAVPAIAAAARSWLETHPEPTSPAPPSR